MEDAEELMLDAFAAVATGAPAFDPERKFKTWLFTIGRNMAVSHMRKKNLETFSIDAIKGAQYATEDEYFHDEKYKELYRALEKLNSEYRQVLFLLYFEDLDVDETAKIMKKTKKQVYNLTFQGKRALKNILDEMNIGHDEFL